MSLFKKLFGSKENYIETENEREEGHVDTREKNFECEDKDPNLGCTKILKKLAV